MDITRDAIGFDVTDPALVRITYIKLLGGRDMGGKSVLERGTVPWLLNQLESCPTRYGYPQAETVQDNDRIRVYKTGAE